MKRTTKLLCLLLILLVVSLAAAITPYLIPQEAAQAADTSATLLSLDPESVTGLGWENLGGEALSFTKDGGSWVYDADREFPLNTKILESILSGIRQVSASRTIEAPDDPALYGLNEPWCTVTVTAGGERYELLLGDETGLGGERYLSNGDGKVYLVSAELLDYFDYGLYDLVQYETLPDLEDAAALTIRAETQNLSLVRMENSGLAYSDAYVWFREADGEYTALDTALVESLLNVFRELGWAECVNYHADEAALAEYGLDTPTATVTIGYTPEDGETGAFVLEIGDYDGSYCYARLGGSGMVYHVSASVSDTALYTTADTLLPRDVLLMDWDTVTAMDIILEDEVYTVSFETVSATDDEGNVTETRVYKLDGREVSLERVLDALDAIASAGYAYGITPERSQEIAFRIHREHETYPEVALAFYQYDSTTCLTQLMGESTVLTGREDIADLVGKVQSVLGI